MPALSNSTADSSNSRWREFSLFARNFLRHPLSVGTFAPSSGHVVDRLLGRIDFAKATTLVEYGPGIGTITAELLQRMRPEARLLAIETNGDFVEFLRQRLPDPRAIYLQGSAADIQQMLDEHDLQAPDVVISGIPFTTLPPDLRQQLLDITAEILPEHGQFLVYQYSALLRDDLQRRFGVVEHATEWRNVWPMNLFTCSQPVPTATTATAQR